MEKIFTPNRWFIGFCALLIVVVGALKIVGDMHLAEEAKLVAANIFSFDWPGGVESRVQSINAHVLSHSEHDAVVEVSGRQWITQAIPPQEEAALVAESAATTAPGATPAPAASGTTAASTPATSGTPAVTAPAATPAASANGDAPGKLPGVKSEPFEFKAVLTFYRANNIWELGKVEQVN